MKRDSTTHPRATARALRVLAAAVLLSAGVAGGPATARAENLLLSTLSSTVASQDVLLLGGDELIAQSFVTGNAVNLSSVVLSLPTNPAAYHLSVNVYGSSYDAGIDRGDGSFGSYFPDLSSPVVSLNVVTSEGGDNYRFSQYGNAATAALNAGTRYWITLGGDAGGEWDYTFDTSFSSSQSAVIPDADQVIFYDGSTWNTVFNLSDGPHLFAVRYTANTAVEIVDFAARWEGDAVRVGWTTGAEEDNAGFRIWRSGAADGEYAEVSGGLIPAEGGAAQGAAYAFTDRDVTPGATYWYQLEDVDTSGTSSFRGPVTTAGVYIALRTPSRSATVRANRRPRFSWEGDGVERYRVRFSRTPDFSSGVRTLPRPAGTAGEAGWIAGTSFTPTRAEWRRIRRLASRRGRVYWQVLGVDAGGNEVASDAARFRIR